MVWKKSFYQKTGVYNLSGPVFFGVYFNPTRACTVFLATFLVTLDPYLRYRGGSIGSLQAGTEKKAEHGFRPLVFGV